MDWTVIIDATATRLSTSQQDQLTAGTRGTVSWDSASRRLRVIMQTGDDMPVPATPDPLAAVTAAVEAFRRQAITTGVTATVDGLRVVTIEAHAAEAGLLAS